jgi:arsenate reductase
LRTTPAQITEILDIETIPEERMAMLEPLQSYIRSKLDTQSSVNLNFICTHNSRRSQLSQVWAKLIANHYGFTINTFSGGIEITACNQRTVASLMRMGFEIEDPGGENPHYQLTYDRHQPPMELFSKIYDDPPNPKHDFAAVMTCTHADENCPFIPGAERRISLPYEDPKAYDDTPQEAMMYNERSLQIATEMKLVFGGLSA